MRSRLAQIVAGAVGPDGKIDRTKVYAALVLTPDAPEALLIDAFLATEEGLQDFGKAVATQATALHGVFAAEATQLRTVFVAHQEATDAVKEQLAYLFEELKVARVQARGKLEIEAANLRELGTIIAADAHRLADHSRRAPFVAFLGIEVYLPEAAALRATLLITGGFLAGVSTAFIYVLTRP